MPASEVSAELLGYDVPMVVITGGEPLQQQARLEPVVRDLLAAGREVEVETNGTVVPTPEFRVPGVRFNVSPKLASAGDTAGRRIRHEALAALQTTDGVAFKFVCADPGELAEVHDLAQTHRLAPIWIMPRGRTPEELGRSLRAIADHTVRYGWNLTTRLHILAWNDERGR